MPKPTEHLTTIHRIGSRWITAQCPEHGPIGLRQIDSTGGRNAVVTEARAHDDIAHGVYRPTTESYWAAVAAASDG